MREEYREFSVVRSPAGEEVMWCILDAEVRDDTVYLICVNERDEPEVVQVPVSRLKALSRNSEWYSLVNMFNQREESTKAEEFSAEVMETSVPKISFDLHLSEKGEEDFLSWLRTASSVQKSSLTPSSQGTEAVTLEDLETR